LTGRRLLLGGLVRPSWLFAAVLGLASSGCTMGQPCKDSIDCRGGTCIKGACSGYACDRDDDCTGGFVCGSVLAAQVCVLHCESDDDCPGTQTCADIAETIEDDSPRSLVCI